MVLYKFTVSKQCDAMRLSKYLRMALPLISNSTLNKALNKKDIRVNDQKTDQDLVLKAGDQLAIYLPLAQREPQIVYEDPNILIADKPAGISSDSAIKDEHTMLTWAQNKLTDAPSVKLCHRLDNQTSGLLVLAKNEPTYEAMTLAFKNRQVVKEYHAVVKGRVKQDHAITKAFLRKNPKTAQVSVASGFKSGAHEIITEFDVIRRSEDRTEVLVTLHTGKTHQIRAHMAFLGHPVLGDDLYGDRAFNKEQRTKNLCLRAVSLTFLAQDGPVSYLYNQRFEVKLNEHTNPEED